MCLLLFFFNLGEYYDSAMTVNGLDTFQQLVDELKLNIISQHHQPMVMGHEAITQIYTLKKQSHPLPTIHLIQMH